MTLCIAMLSCGGGNSAQNENTNQPQEECGDGIVTDGEACDDGNGVDGDGCAATCDVELGWACAGQPSVCIQDCGDGNVTGGEACDDGNAVDGDGCRTTCETFPVPVTRRVTSLSAAIIQSMPLR